MADIIDFQKAKDKKKADDVVKDIKDAAVEQIDATTSEILENIAKKNKENREREKEDREKANKSVLHSYKIKPKQPKKD